MGSDSARECLSPHVGFSSGNQAQTRCAFLGPYLVRTSHNWTVSEISLVRVTIRWETLRYLRNDSLPGRLARVRQLRFLWVANLAENGRRPILPSARFRLHGCLKRTGIALISLNTPHRSAAALPASLEFPPRGARRPPSNFRHTLRYEIALARNHRSLQSS
jgi:hypothetical protein